MASAAIQFYSISFSGMASILEASRFVDINAPGDLTLSYIQSITSNWWRSASSVYDSGLMSDGSTWDPFSIIFRIPKSQSAEFSSILVTGASGDVTSVLFDDDEYRYLAIGAPSSEVERTLTMSFAVTAIQTPAAESSNIREDACFSFWKNGTERFYPESGAVLHFASKDVDTLRLPGLPNGTLVSGDSVTVKYRPRGPSTWKTVFVGTVESIVDRHGHGTERVNDIVCQGPWGKMNRLVFRQSWGNGSYSFSSPRIVLNQTSLGVDCTMTEQVREILNFGSSKCGYSVGTVSASDIYLPKDETRDMTCASALQRELRFFPKKIVRFDYSTTQPTIHVSEPSGTTDALYVATIPKTAREYEYTAHPITGVDIYTADTDVVTGSDGTDQTIRNLTHQVYPSDCNTNDLDVLHAFIPLAGGSASTSWEKFACETEELPADLRNKTWWKEKHPRLSNVSESQITVEWATRSMNNSYPRIAKSTAKELNRAGLHYGIERFKASVTIKTADDEEENILLTMDFLMTDAKTKDYTWQTGSSATAAESLPSGLAEAIYKQRSGSLRNETMTIRLGDAFPVLGDIADGLFLQSFDVDCYDLTATLRFGQPEFLSVEDMRDLLNGFRQRGFASNAPARTGDEEDQEDAAVEVGGVPPIASTEFSPGTKTKTTIKTPTGGSGGNIVLDSSSVPSGHTIGVHTLKFTDKDGNVKSVCFLACGDLETEDTGGSSGGGTGGEEDPTTPPSGNLHSGDVSFVSSMSYDTGTQQFRYKTVTMTFNNGLLTSVADEVEPETVNPVFTAVAHESGMD